jgi:membrane fusion protein, multidrug efflux system
LPVHNLITMQYKHLTYAGILVILLNSCAAKTENSKATAGRSNDVGFIEGVVAKPTLLEQNIVVSGTLKPFEETVLVPDVGGRVVSINFQEGMHVTKGTLLVQLFNDDLKAQLHKVQAQKDLAEQTEKRQSELIKINGISQLDYDQSVLQVNSLNADLEVIRAQLRKTEILAPFDGVIGLRNISVGAVVSQTTPLATIRQLSPMKLEFSFPGKYISSVKKGTRLKFTVQGTDHSYEAVVMATEEGIDASTRNLQAKALVSGKTEGLVPGMFANVALILNENPRALMIPTQAIIPDAQKKKVIVSRAGKATFTDVTTGVRQATDIEIVSGIQSGDTVVTTGIQFIKPGSALKFSKVN